MSERRAFARPKQTLAILPSALDLDFLMFAEPTEPYELVGSTAVIRVDGPIDFADGWFQTYASILDRAWSAFEDPNVASVVLDCNSPGGSVRGMLTTARSLRELADSAGKPYDAWVTGDACSACYGLAVSADRVMLKSPDSQAASIGTTLCRPDVTQADAQAGLRFTYISSAEAKNWGNPHVAATTSEVAHYERMVEADAESFFAWVSERRGIPVDAIRAQKAATYFGQAAIDQNLADGFAQSIDELTSTRTLADSQSVRGKTVPFADLVNALTEAAQGEGDEAEQAKKMLAAVAPPDEEPEGDEPPADDDDKDKAEGVTVSVSAQSAAEFVQTIATLQSRLELLEAGNEDAQRAALLAQVEPKLAASLQKVPLTDARSIVAALPKRERKQAVATLQPKAVHPDTTEKPGLIGADLKRMNVAFGLEPNARLDEPNTLKTFSRVRKVK